MAESDVFAVKCDNVATKKIPSFKSRIKFSVNGVTYTAGNEFSVSTSLADFLRKKRVSMGTKVMCKQGGCGICVVVATIYRTATHQKTVANLNACLCPLFLCDGWEITTVEGIGSTRTGLHKIQSNLADFMGTQCGYCTPGFVMNMHGLMLKYPKLTKQLVEDQSDGILCRCTGYRSILDAFKALVPASPCDIEDLSAEICINDSSKACNAKGNCGGECQSRTNDAHDPVLLAFDRTLWVKAADYSHLMALLEEHEGKKIRLMGANTGTGVFWYKENIGNFEVVIDITGISGFYTNTYECATGTFVFGANITLSDMIEVFEERARKSGNRGSFNELTKYLYKVGSSPIRNRATWSGNLVLKRHMPSFPSDILNVMTVLEATLCIGPTSQDFMNTDTFLHTDMSGKVIHKATFKDIPENDIIACFKVMPRLQNSLALIAAAFRCSFGQEDKYTVTGRPIISIQGISGSFQRASKTEAYLVGKNLSTQSTLAGAVEVLSDEVLPSSDIGIPCPAYRRIVACALLYKYFLHVLGSEVDARYRSGRTVLSDTRPLSSGKQGYDTNKLDWPLHEPLKKLEANIQSTGEAEYVDDIDPMSGQLYASFVKSTKANATVQSIDTTAALGLPGVYRVITATDIPEGGKNDLLGWEDGSDHEKDEVLSSGPIHFYGQPVALVLAETQELADNAAFMVRVTYTNVRPPVMTIDDALEKGEIIHTPDIPDVVVGDAENAVATSSHVTSGSFYLPSQYHFYMETQSCIAIPTADGLVLKTTTQWIAAVQTTVAQICGLQKSKVRVEVDRLGGGFGGKILNNCLVASACGLAAHVTNRPVRMRLALWDNMKILGKRAEYKATYKVGHDEDGKLNGIIVTYYADLGCNKNVRSTNHSVLGALDNGYFCDTWKANVVSVRTNKPVMTFCRAPGVMPAIFVMEQIMEHVSRTVGKEPLVVKTLNLYQKDQITPVGMTLRHCNLTHIMEVLLSSAEIISRQREIDSFNKNNRWKKKGLAVVPLKFGVMKTFVSLSAQVNIHSGDGSVLVNHGGIEMGQGINTKVAQVCAHELGIPITMVTVEGTNSVTDVNNSPDGASCTSESACQTRRVVPVVVSLDLSTPLSGNGMQINKLICRQFDPVFRNTPNHPAPFEYNSYGAACSEVELDVLTGEYQLTRADIVFDCGHSLNPAVDIGQVEGAFIMGMGYSTTEDIKYDLNTGQLLTKDTWTYHPPTSKDIPVDFRVNLLKDAPNPSSVLQSKVVGEPPLCMSCSVFFAIRKCIEEARKEAGNTDYFEFNPPATVEKVQQACLVNTLQFLLK